MIFVRTSTQTVYITHQQGWMSPNISYNVPPNPKWGVKISPKAADNTTNEPSINATNHVCRIWREFWVSYLDCKSVLFTDNNINNPKSSDPIPMLQLQFSTRLTLQLLKSNVVFVMLLNPMKFWWWWWRWWRVVLPQDHTHTFDSCFCVSPTILAQSRL